MSEYQICGLGNAIVDIFLELNDSRIRRAGLSSAARCGSSNRLSSASCWPAFTVGNPGWLAAARSPIRSSPFRSSAAMRLSSAASATIATDCSTRPSSRNSASTSATRSIVGETTGTCVCIITPDAERTMRTCLAVSSHLADRHVDEERIKNSEWLFIEGYVFANPHTGQGAVREAIKLAKTARRQDRPDLLGCVHRQRLRRCVPRRAQADRPAVLQRQRSRRGDARAATAEEAFAKLKDMVPSCVVTDGPHGAYIRHEGSKCTCRPSRATRRT